MPPFQLFPHARARALWIVAACAVVLGAAFACSRASDIHESDEVKGKPCLSCHTGAYNAATNPRHVNELPVTCQDCHGTKAWVPSTAKDHPYWPILNKHVGVSCAACHTKGYKVGDTPKDCLGCHRKDYESAQTPYPGFLKHVANGADQYPLDCAMCHADTGFKPSSWKHLPELPPELVRLVRDTGDAADGGALFGGHFNAPCTGCHIGSPPTYKGTPTDSDCYRCHKDDADNRPSHAAFAPRVLATCLNCHFMSGWKNGPPLSGLHPEAKFPLQTGKHADPRIVCRDCHDIFKGLPAANTDCVHCHLDGPDKPGTHVIPEIDARHRDGGTAAAYQTLQQGAATTNFCLGCHDKGQPL